MGDDSRELPDVLSGQKQSSHIYTDDSWLEEYQPLTDMETERKRETHRDASLISLGGIHFMSELSTLKK